MPLSATVSVVLPAHNEADNVADVVRKCLSSCSVLFSGCEVIVVDDGSEDATSEVVENAAKEDPRVRLVRHDINRGYGAALRSGFAAAKSDWIFFTDSDGQFDPAEMEQFVPLLEGNDIIAGFRIKRMDNSYRRFMGRLYTFLVDLFFGAKIKDVNCAFKFIRADLLRGIELTSEGALINAEMIALARKRGACIIQKGVHHYPRKTGEQSGGSPHVILKALKEYWWLYRRLKK